MPPSLADPQGSLRAALTPGWSRDIDGSGCVVVAVVPAPQEFCTDPQSTCPTQGLNAPHLQQRHLPALPAQVSAASSVWKAEVTSRVRQDPPGVSSVRMPSPSSGLQPPSLLRPILTTSTIINRVQPFLLHFGTELDSQLVVYFRKGGVLSDLCFLWGSY